MQKEEKEEILNRVLEKLEKLNLLLCDDFYCYYDNNFLDDKKNLKKAISELQTIHTNRKDKFRNLTDFIVMIYTSQNYNIKKTLSTLKDLDISISDKQLRNILTKEKIYRGRTDKDD